jgi:hypothetical protein
MPSITPLPPPPQNEPNTAPTHVDPCVDVAVRSGLELDGSTGGIAVNQQLEVRCVCDVCVVCV